MDIAIVKRVMEEIPHTINEFRLSGDAQILQFIIEQAIIAQSPDLTKDFYNDMTETEKKAFEFITTELDLQNGYVSIVKLIQRTNISRPVFASLFQKMEKFGIAQIKNCGVKGTLIEWKKISLNK